MPVGPSTNFRSNVVSFITTSIVGISFATWLITSANKKWSEDEAKYADPNFPKLTITRNLEEVQKADGKVEKIVKTQEGREYVLRDCDSKFNPKPQDIDGPYNPNNLEIICIYDLEGERSYMRALERAEEIFAKEMEARKR